MDKKAKSSNTINGLELRSSLQLSSPFVSPLSSQNASPAETPCEKPLILERQKLDQETNMPERPKSYSIAVVSPYSHYTAGSQTLSQQSFLNTVPEEIILPCTIPINDLPTTSALLTTLNTPTASPTVSPLDSAQVTPSKHASTSTESLINSEPPNKKTLLDLYIEQCEQRRKDMMSPSYSPYSDESISPLSPASNTSFASADNKLENSELNKRLEEVSNLNEELQSDNESLPEI